MHGLPIVLNVQGWRALVVGGGRVAARKARQLLAAGADVFAVAPAFGDDFPDDAERLARPFEAGDVAGCRIAFACADDPAVNDAVVAASRAAGVLANRADAGDADLRALAAWREGEVLVAASAGGAALSAKLRADLVNKLDRRYLTLAAVMADERPALVAENRPDLLRWLASDEALDLASDGPALRHALAERRRDVPHRRGGASA